MIPRGKLDITYTDIFVGFYYCLARGLKHRHPALFPERGLYCLSVRSGFDLVLQALKLAPGSEVLVSDISIPGMFDIIAAHGLVAVPLPLNKHTLGIGSAAFEAAISPASKIVVLTHLFGGCMPADELMSIARNRGLLVIEDCAQAFCGTAYVPGSRADVCMFSFGMIKTNTALSGALLYFNHTDLMQQVAGLQAALPQQHTLIYVKKLWLALLIKVLTTPAVFTAFYRFMQVAGMDTDAVLAGFTRGFGAQHILNSIRYKPGPAIMYMLNRRLSRFNPAQLSARRIFAWDIVNRIPAAMRIGAGNAANSFWVLPVAAERPDELIALLRKAGFDATAKASSLVKLVHAVAATHPDELRLEKILYLPMWPGMAVPKRLLLVKLLKEHEERCKRVRKSGAA